MVLSGATDATALTQTTRRPQPLGGGSERYRAYDTPVARGRSIWPWLIGLGVALALAAGGYFAYQKIQDQLDKSKPVRVEQYTGIKVENAKTLVKKHGFEPQVVFEANADVPVGIVFKQDPIEGTNVGRGSPVTLTVSTGKPKIPVPGVVGKSLADAVAALTSVKLQANPQNVPSDQAAGTVIAQDPKAGTVVVEETRVRINVSKGPKQVFLPSVVGLSYDQASAQLQTAGFAVRRVDVESDRPANEVTRAEPGRQRARRRPRQRDAEGVQGAGHADGAGRDQPRHRHRPDDARDAGLQGEGRVHRHDRPDPGRPRDRAGARRAPPRRSRARQ